MGSKNIVQPVVYSSREEQLRVEKLFRENMKYAKIWLKRVQRIFLDPVCWESDDIYSLLLERIWYVCRLYDPTRDTAISSLIYLNFKNLISQVTRLNKRKIKYVKEHPGTSFLPFDITHPEQYDDPDNEDNPLPESDGIFVDSHDFVNDLQARMFSDSVMRFEGLTENEKEALRLHANGVPYKDIGAALGVNKQRAAEIVRRAKARVRRELKIGE